MLAASVGPVRFTMLYAATTTTAIAFGSFFSGFHNDHSRERGDAFYQFRHRRGGCILEAAGQWLPQNCL
ncbi:hypothetical protein CO657_28580 (plasmid) [Rhizobium acidisoli]|uniref:Uncharacterized protein n=1 Tax=Rhizobium acidisoli TaxID=1538158 RepID=A0AAE5WSM8_9HYPH|nr:hypothetical protein [Rhizobium acidisoli]QAS81813.1 hypothetical protein CO657_28580 [Rhizobium acidisoli]